MSYNWFQPKTWKAGEALTPALLNRFIGDQNDFLRYRNRVSALNTTAYAPAVATLAALDDTVFRLSFYVNQGEDVRLILGIDYTLSLVTTYMFADVWVDDSYYLSSGTATPLTRGIVVATPYVASAQDYIRYSFPITGLETGTHTFSLHMARAAGTLGLLRTEMILEGY